MVCWACERAVSPDGDPYPREYAGGAYYHDQCAVECGVPEEDLL